MSTDIEDLLVCEIKKFAEKDLMKIICDYFEKYGFEWNKLVGFCTDGTPAMQLRCTV